MQRARGFGTIFESHASEIAKDHGAETSRRLAKLMTEDK